MLINFLDARVIICYLLLAAVEFFTRFNFTKELAGRFSLELEFFLTDPNTGKPVPRAKEFLEIANDPAWTYEFSACQVEVRVSLCRSFDELRSKVEERILQGRRITAVMGLSLVACEAWTGDMPLDHYPDDRYPEIAKKLSKEVLDAICRVTGVHVHIGMKNMADAIEAYNRVVGLLSRLERIADHSSGKRFELFERFIYPEVKPRAYRSLADVLEHAINCGWLSDFGRCWTWVRISRHGTVEVRIFGASLNPDEIVAFAKAAVAAANGDDEAFDAACVEAIAARAT